MDDVLTWFWSISLISQIVLIWFVGINVVTFFVYGYDKMMATAGRRRVPEKKLWLFALVGGSLGAMIAMEYFRHKTKKMSFYSLLLLIFLAQALLIFFLVLGDIPRYK